MDSDGVAAENSIHDFLFSSNKKLQHDADILNHLRDPEQNAARSMLFNLPPSSRISYDQVFVGRILFESSFYGNLLEQLITSGLPLLSSHYHVSHEWSTKVATTVNKWTSRSSRNNRDHVRRLFVVASLSIDVLFNNHDILPLFCTKGYNKEFVSALIGLDGALEGPQDMTLPSFAEFLQRFQKAVDFFINLRSGPSEATLSSDCLVRQHGLAYKADSDTLMNGLLTNDLLTSTDAVKALSPCIVDILKSGLDGYVDVKLGYTLLTDITLSDDEATPFDVKKLDLHFDDYRSMLLGLYGHFLSPVFVSRFLDHVYKDLSFCKSPTGNRMLRVSSINAPRLFLLGDKVCIVLSSLTPSFERNGISSCFACVSSLLPHSRLSKPLK